MEDVVSPSSNEGVRSGRRKLDQRVYGDRATVEVFAENGSVHCAEGRKHLGAPLKDFMISVDGVSAK